MALAETAGPWQIKPADIGFRIVGGRGIIADRIVNPADARLIAAAPTLLVFLRAKVNADAEARRAANEPPCDCWFCEHGRGLIAFIETDL